MESTQLSRLGTSSRFYRRFREVEDGRQNHAYDWHEKGRVRCRGCEAKTPIRTARTLRSGRPGVLDLDRHSRDAETLCFELQSVFRDEGVAFNGYGEELQGDEDGPGISQGGRTRTHQYLVTRGRFRQEGAMVRRGACVLVQEP